ncbi:MAG: hypothetical protein Q9202_000569 [Teloschistes flavicans]
MARGMVLIEEVGKIRKGTEDFCLLVSNNLQMLRMQMTLEWGQKRANRANVMKRGSLMVESQAQEQEQRFSKIKRTSARNVRTEDDDHLEVGLSEGRLLRRASGTSSDDDEDDVTSYFPRYREWGPQRWNRPPTIFLYRSGDYPIPTYSVSLWYHEGRLVISPDRKPLFQWEHLPATISSNITGTKGEALCRLDRRIATANLIARTPLSVHTAGKTKTTKDRYNVIRKRARIRMCCRFWDGVAFASEINAYLDAKLPAENHLSNNTKSFRDPAPQEVKKPKNKPFGGREKARRRMR